MQHVAGNVPASSTRRRLLVAGSAALGLAALGGSVAGAEPHDDRAQWIANHVETRLTSVDGAPVAWLPRWTRMRILRPRPNGWLEVWVPRLNLTGRVLVSAIGPVGAPSPAELAQEKAEPIGPPIVESIGLPGRIVGGGANLRLYPEVRQDTMLRPLPVNASLRVLASVEGADGDVWYQSHLLDPATNDPIGVGYVHNSLVRLPRLRLPVAADRMGTGRWFEADLREPVLLTAFEDGAPIWSSLAVKGRATSRTATGEHEIIRRVANETMNSETLYPPVPRNAPGGYYLKDVLYTQYFLWDGSSIHYNYWNVAWGYAGSNGCLGLPLHEARFAWEFAEIGTRLHIFA